MNMFIITLFSCFVFVVLSIIVELKLKSESRKIVFSMTEAREKFQLKENLTLDDQIQISHKDKNGVYVTAFVSLKQLKEFINNT